MEADKQEKTFRVRITKCSSSQSWYRNRVGYEYDVYHELGTDSNTFTLEYDRLNRLTRRFIDARDCLILEQCSTSTSTDTTLLNGVGNTQQE